MIEPNEKKPEPKSLTYDKDYVEDREAVDNLSKSMRNQIGQLNKRLKVIQITDFKLRLNEPEKEVKKQLTWWQKFLNLFRKKKKLPNEVKHKCTFSVPYKDPKGLNWLRCSDPKCSVTIPNYGEWIEYNKRIYGIK